MTISLAEKQAVTFWIGQTLVTLNRLDLETSIDVRWNSRYTSKMGSARYNYLERRHLIQLSVPLWPRAMPKERRETTIHEVCHIVARYNAHALGRKIKPHGVEWKTLMRKCGLKPKVTHSVSNEGLSKRKRVEVHCGCQTNEVTPYVAGRIAAGAIYKCCRCNVRLKAPEGTKPVARRKRRRR